MTEKKAKKLSIIIINWLSILAILLINTISNQQFNLHHTSLRSFLSQVCRHILYQIISVRNMVNDY